MKNDKEIVGTLNGFDDFVNMLLDDVTEYEATPEGRRITKLDQILLNGNNITMVSIQLFSLLFMLSDFSHGTLMFIIGFDSSWCQEEKCQMLNFSTFT